MTDAEQEGLSSEIGMGEMFGLVADSGGEQRRLRLLNAGGEEQANAIGRLIGSSLVEEQGNGFVEVFVHQGGLSARVKIAIHPETRCTISPDGTLTGTLRDGATWIVSPE